MSVWRRLLGVMSSMSSLVPGARLRMRSLQLHLNVSGPLLREAALVSWDDCCHPGLLWWSDVSHLQVGLLLGKDLPDLFLYTDASNTGWRGLSWRRPSLRLVVSPLLPIFEQSPGAFGGALCGSRFSPIPPWSCLVVFSDNTTALAYLKKQGGTRSSMLNEVAQTGLRLCEVSGIHLLSQFIPGKLNVLADSLSRRSQVIGSEWTLCSEAFLQLLRQWPATVDLFATALNHCLPVYFSLMVDPQSAGTDAMLQRWNGLQAYAFPPFGLISGPGEGLAVSGAGADLGGSVLAAAPVVPGPSGVWWQFPSPCHEGGICSDSPTFIIFTRTSPCFN